MAPSGAILRTSPWLKTKTTNQERTNRMIKMFNKAKGCKPLAGTKDLILASLIVGSLALPFITQAGQHPRYKLIDLGTLGGPGSRILADFSKVLNNAGIVVGEADTSTPDVQHAFRWQNGVMTDLGVLPGGNSSHPFRINDTGLSVGFSDNGVTDPLTGSPEFRAVLWNKNGEILNLGTLGGNSSYAFGINNRGQVVGFALNATPDPFSLNNWFGGDDVTQTRAFLWENGAMRDLGSLGGTFADVFGINNRGQVAGHMALPGDEFVHPYFWEGGTLTDVGTLGG